MSNRGWPKGKPRGPHSEEHKAKMRGPRIPYGPMSQEHKQHITEAKPDQCGDRNPNWKDGNYMYSYPVEFNGELRESIRERDNYTCQLCGKIQEEEYRKLSIHHINHDKDDLSEDNLITLCGSCNSIVESKKDYKMYEDYFAFKLMGCIV